MHQVKTGHGVVYGIPAGLDLHPKKSFMEFNYTRNIVQVISCKMISWHNMYSKYSSLM